MPQRGGMGAVLAPRMKTRYSPIRAKERLMRICSCSFLRSFLGCKILLKTGTWVQDSEKKSHMTIGTIYALSHPFPMRNTGWLSRICM